MPSPAFTSTPAAISSSACPFTKENVGSARVTGIEFDYQQPLSFLPHWARGTMVFFNLTKTHLEGASTANFSGFTRESVNWGVSLSRPRLGQVTGTYSYNP